MQQQITQQEQYGNHQQISQPMMLCPIQYVYETPVMMPQAQEEQIRQNQTVLFNVQNPPPWIQNRPQTQVIYVQQVPNNYQTYMHPQMVQSPIYQQQINYQIQQPVLAQENRQYVQIPNLAAYNTVQNQPVQPIVQQQINGNEATERMPLLTQMLSQKNNTVNVNNSNNTRGTIVTSIRPTTPTTNNVNIQRPVTQNQQVQTNISANNKGRPRNGSPQIITINPMQQRQFVNVNEKSDVLINLSRPIAPYIRPDVPQHIRSKIPSSISVKTINRPQQPRSTIRPLDIMPSPQNFYYNPNYVPIQNPDTRNIMTNTDSSFFKLNNNCQDPKAAESNLSVIEKMSTAKEQNEANTSLKQQVNDVATGKSKFNLVKINDERNEQKGTETAIVRNIETQTQTEEKLIRNTVYVQARGRVRNEKEIPQSQSLKRTIQEKPEDEKSVGNPSCHDNHLSSNEDRRHSSNKYFRVEVTDSQTNKISPNSSASSSNQYFRVEGINATAQADKISPKSLASSSNQYLRVEGINGTAQADKISPKSLASNSNQYLRVEGTNGTAQADKISPKSLASSSNQYFRVEGTNDTLQADKISPDSLVTAAKVPRNIETQQTEINHTPAKSDNAERLDLNTPKADNITNLPLVLNIHNPEVPNLTKEANTDLKQNNISIKISEEIEEINFGDKIILCNAPDSEKNSSDLKEKESSKDTKQDEGKSEKIELLTHVLDGYIIQESNVAFPIYKPIIEYRNKQDTLTEQEESNQPKTEDNIDNAKEADATNKQHTPWRFKNTNFDTEKEIEVAVINKDDPFANTQKSTVESWTTEELAAHLGKYDWLETAAKLQDEEIDGQSILLVNRDQLIAIGVCEKHADVIAAFSAS